MGSIPKRNGRFAAQIGIGDLNHLSATVSFQSDGSFAIWNAGGAVETGTYTMQNGLISLRYSVPADTEAMWYVSEDGGLYMVAFLKRGGIPNYAARPIVYRYLGKSRRHCFGDRLRCAGRNCAYI